jgi:hypothetical protein
MSEQVSDSTASTSRTIRAQLRFSNELPPGCPPFELPEGNMLMEIELPHLTLLIIPPGSMDRSLYDAFNRYMERVCSQGNWIRNPARDAILGALAVASPA